MSETKRPGRACTIWFTGLSGAGKTTCSTLVAEHIRTLGRRVEHLDGDVIRTNLSKGLGYSKADRDTNIRRIGWVCEVLTRNDVFVCAAAISPYRDLRREVRAAIGDFVLVFCSAPLAVLEERDTKGLYKKARSGEIKQFTGISDPYHEPENAEITVHTGDQTIEESAQAVLDYLVGQGLISAEKVGSEPALS